MNASVLDILEPQPVTRCAKDIEPRDLEPIWPGVLWIGKPTLLAGDPGLGKSLITVDIAARVSKGSPWPCDTAERAPANVLILSAEDDPDDTIVPRLIAAGAELKRITFFDAVREFDKNGTPHDGAVSLDRHIDALRAALIKSKAQLVIIDPISAFLGRLTRTLTARCAGSWRHQGASRRSCALLCW